MFRNTELSKELLTFLEETLTGKLYSFWNLAYLDIAIKKAYSVIYFCKYIQYSSYI